MTTSTRGKNLLMLVTSFVSLFLVLLGSTMAEGDFIVIRKATLYAIAAALGPIVRAAGELIRNGDREEKK